MSMLDHVRNTCTPGYWAQGVKLARKGVVFEGEPDPDDEDAVVLRVSVPRAPVPLTVYLWPEDKDWSCDCPGDLEVCAHVAAAVIAWSQAKKSPKPEPTVDAPPAVLGKIHALREPAGLGYRFTRTDRGPILTRVLIQNGQERPLVGGLAGRMAQSVAMMAQPMDLEIERVMGLRWGSLVPRELSPRLCVAMDGASGVQLDGQPVVVSRRPVLPVGWVDDDPNPDNADGFRVRLVRDPDILEALRSDLVRCKGPAGDLIRVIGTGGIATEERHRLYRGLCFASHEVGRLVGQLLPRLRQRVDVQIHTERLPESSDSRPRVLLETKVKGETLTVRPVIVYGDPPQAKVDRGRWVVMGSKVPVRNERAERDLVARTRENLGLSLGLETLMEGADAVRFVDQMPRGWSLEGHHWKRFRSVDEVEPQVTIEGRNLHMELGGIDPHRLVDAWMAGEEMVPTGDGWAPLPVDWLERHGHLLADLLSARSENGEVSRHALLDLARLAEALDQPQPPDLDVLRTLLTDFDGIQPVGLPEDLDVELRDYQRKGVDWLGFLRTQQFGGILADDMGLGKTLQALTIMNSGEKSLVVAPTSVLHNWLVEAARFRPALKTCRYHGPNRKMDPDADLIVTTYGVLRMDQEKLREQQWQILVLDEAQAIKNPESQSAQAAFSLHADFRLAMTGTPVENRLDELWSQLHFSNPGLLGGRSDFRNRYSQPIAMGEPGVAAHLRTRIKPFVLRRLKADVAKELPARIEVVRRCTLSPEERNAYDSVRAATHAEMVEKMTGGHGVMAALEALLRLRQAACHRGMLPGQSAPDSSKIRLLLESLGLILSGGHRSLVFSQWTSLLDRVEPHLKAAGIDFLRLDGSTRNRGKLVEKFQAEDGPPVFLISLKAGGTGLNLTAADHVFLLDPWWNPAVEDQAADRAHRIGQDKPVIVTRLVAEDTVEERILALQKKKRALADAALGGASQAGGITRAELLELLG
jgi:superfamily II DNA or RNA helicase